MNIGFLFIFFHLLQTAVFQQDSAKSFQQKAVKPFTPEWSNPLPQKDALLIVQVRNVRTAEGVLRLGFYNSQDDFPDVPHRNLVFPKTRMEGDVVTDTVINITPGTYALTLLDDTNSNGEMDYTFLGMPREGFGFSNDAKPKLLKSPDFESCSFRVNPGINRITFRVQYF